VQLNDEGCVIPPQPLDHEEEVIRSIEFRTWELAQWMEVDIVDAYDEDIEDGLEQRAV